MESKITSFETACKFLKKDANKLPIVKGLDKRYQKYLIANYKLAIITEALNKEYSQQNGLKKTWEPDFTQPNQWKYFPWFEVKADSKRTGGFGFSYTDYDLWHTFTSVGSRFCFPTSELAIYSGKQFEKLHLENQLILK